MQIDQALIDEMVEQGIAECARLHFGGNTRQVHQALLKGACEHCKCIAESLARQISENLVQVEKGIKAVYRYDSAPSPETQPTEGDTSGAHAGIHLIVWVEQKSPALSAWVETLKALMIASQRGLGCPTSMPDCLTLDIETVDDRDVREHRGLGMLVNSPALRSQLVSKRSEGPLQLVDHEEEELDRVRHALPESFDPELIPEARLIDHALVIEQLAPEERGRLEHHLIDLKVTLIRRIISDQLRYINLAKQWFTVADLANIYHRRIGFGRIGGKSAGMLLAGRILNEVASQELKACIQVPESFFLGSDLMYIFMSMNGLMHWNDQKYKPEDRIRSDYPQVRDEFIAGQFPPEVLAELRAMLEEIGPVPVIVRSSSQLEDNLGTSFAGKYDSHFCPNQSTPEENLRGLGRAIASTYASTFKPDALLYRRSRGLQDYDERMAVLIQPVKGEKLGGYYLPLGAGVAFSRNLYRWAPEIRREDGFMRLVWGLGTRAVDRVGNDFPHLVALSHPNLQPDDSPEAVRHYSQQYVDLIDLKDNRFKTLPVREVLTPQYPPIRFLVQLDQDGYLATPYTRVMESDISRLVITFDQMLLGTRFASLMSETLRLLEQHCQSPVDIEFTIQIPDPFATPPRVNICLLQCRPQSRLEATSQVHLPENLREEDTVFSSHFIVPQGFLSNIRHVIFVPPEGYFALPTLSDRNAIGRLIGRLNAVLEKETFICVGPGRWGTTNIDLGVLVYYSDICYTGALVELSGSGVGASPEPSLGTHFFQDLMEAQIYPVAIPLDQADTIFNRDFFYNTPNRLGQYMNLDSCPGDCLRLIEVASFRPGHHLDLIMDDEKGQTVAFLAPDAKAPDSPQTS